MQRSEKARTFESKSLGSTVTYVAYLPAEYETTKTSYPVIYALHGGIGVGTAAHRLVFRGAAVEARPMRRTGRRSCD